MEPILVKQREGAWMLLGAFVALSLSCSLLFTASQVWLPQYAPSDYVVKLCGSVRLTGSFRVATWWSPPTGRFGRPAKGYVMGNIACGFAPWAPVLPQRGNWESNP